MPPAGARRCAQMWRCAHETGPAHLGAALVSESGGAAHCHCKLACLLIAPSVGTLAARVDSDAPACVLK